MNSSFDNDEKKRLIYDFYRVDFTYCNNLYNWYSYYDDNDVYKKEMFKFLSENTPSSYMMNLENNEKKLVK